MKIWSMGVPLDVTFEEAPAAESRHGEASRFTHGQYDASTNELWVNVFGPEDRARSVFLHELLEFISAWGGLNLDENTIRVLEVGLASFVNDPRNDWAVAWLTGDDLPGETP